MSSLVHAALSLRRTARAGFGYLAAFVFAILDLLGVFSIPMEALQVEHFLAGGMWIVLFGFRLNARRQLADDDSATLDVELGLLLLVAAHAVVQVGGGLTGQLYPLVYVVIAFLTSFSSRRAGPVLVAAALLLEAGLYFVTEERTAVRPIALHAAFVVFFGLLSVIFTRAEIERVRRRSQKELNKERERVKDDSRMFRLSSARPDASDEDRLFSSSVDEVHQQLYYVLHLLHRVLNLHTCVLLMLDDGPDSSLQIAELVTHSDDIANGPFKSGEGAVGAVIRRNMVTNLTNLKPGYAGLCYYEGGASVKSFLGTPVVDNGKLVGVLCIDRKEEAPFTSKEEELVEVAIAQALRAFQNERVFVQLEQSKSEQTILYKASQSLGAALDEQAVIDAVLDAAREIAPFDFAAVSLFDPEEKRHSVRRAVGTYADEFKDLTFRHNTSLTAMAVTNKHYLPYRGDFDPRQQTVYTKRANLRGMDSLLILPLIVREDAIGTLAFAAQRKNAFGDRIRPTLQVLGNQCAVALSNAAAIARLEELATIDGLTGCLNKKTFMDELEARLRSAARFGRKLSLVVTDIDHFKSVNDTYGHATGDVVIKELGSILRRMKRETDIVARFGGEEFCILCEETDTEGAILLAERVRTELGETVFQTQRGQLQVKASLGVATFPNHANDAPGLFDVTDAALYVAKNSGRNQVCTPT